MPATHPAADPPPVAAIRVIWPDQVPVGMDEATVAQILDGLSGERLATVWQHLIQALEEGQSEEDRNPGWRAFFLERDAGHVLAGQLQQYRARLAKEDPDAAGALKDPEEGFELYLEELVEIGYCTADSGGHWFTDYVDVPAGLADDAKEAAALLAAEKVIAAGEESVAHVFVYCLRVERE